MVTKEFSKGDYHDMLHKKRPKMSSESVEQRQQRERDELENEISKMLAAAKSKNERKRLNQQAEKMRRDLYEKHESEAEDPAVALARQISEQSGEAPTPAANPAPEDDAAAKAEQKKQQNRERRQRKQQKKMQMEHEFAENLKNVRTKGEIEIEELTAQLHKIHLKMHPVMGDGHCLYRAVAFNLARAGRQEFSEFTAVRAACADEMRKNREKYQDFVGAECYDAYCDKVQNSAEWGGEVELSALSNAFQMSFIVHRRGQEPMKHGDYETTSQVAFLEFFTTSGGHYNSVVEE